MTNRTPTIPKNAMRAVGELAIEVPKYAKPPMKIGLTAHKMAYCMVDDWEPTSKRAEDIHNESIEDIDIDVVDEVPEGGAPPVDFCVCHFEHRGAGRKGLR